MRMLKAVVAVVLVLTALFFITAALLPARFAVARTVMINRPVEAVYPMIVNLSNWSQWDPFTEQDPAAKSSFRGGTGTVGASWSWDGEIIGTGRLTVEEIVPNVSIRSNLEFMAPQPMTAKDIWRFEETDNGTNVTRANEGDLDYPVGRFVGLFMDDMLGPLLEKGLAGLKAVSESRPVDDAYPPDHVFSVPIGEIRMLRSG